MSGKKIGYIRVSTGDQNPERQLQGMQIDKKFIDYSSAKSRRRPQLALMLEFVREDDILYIHSMDRLARNVKDLRNIVDELIEKKVHVHFLKENLIFDGKESSMSNLLLSIMGAFAEFELAFIQERQREGIIVAKKNGKYKGRMKSLNNEEIVWLKNQVRTTRKTKVLLAKQLNISRNTLYRYLKGFDPNLTEIVPIKQMELLYGN